MGTLRHLSARPALVVGLDSLVGNVSGLVGVSGPLGRGRITAALPSASGPRQLVQHGVVCDSGLGYLGDPAGVLVGVPGVTVARMVDAGTVTDTRRLR